MQLEILMEFHSFIIVAKGGNKKNTLGVAF